MLATVTVWALVRASARNRHRGRGETEAKPLFKIRYNYLTKIKFKRETCRRIIVISVRGAGRNSITGVDIYEHLSHSGVCMDTSLLI